MTSPVRPVRQVEGGVPLYAFPRLSGIPGFTHAFTTRLTEAGRPNNLSFNAADAPEQVLANRRTLCEALGIDIATLTVCRQVHGSRAAVVTGGNAGSGGLDPESAVADCDALVSNTAPAAMMILSADCPVVILWDGENRAVGVCHCGWRGILDGIISSTITTMSDAFGTRPGSLLACCAPSIGPCCYEVGRDVAERFRVAFPRSDCVAEREGRAFLDLRAAVSRALEKQGLRPENIEVSEICTKCRVDEFFSYRAEGTKAGRIGVIAALTP
ncbi:MAG: peptidoglycan editing factor PgeF [Planctomycetota bacterium]